MQMMTRKKLMPTTLMVLVSMVALGGLLPVNPGITLLITGGEAWASSLGARPGVGTSAGAGGGAVGAGPGAPVRGAGPGVGTSAGVGGGAVGAGPGAPARGAPGTPVAAPRWYVRCQPRSFCAPNCAPAAALQGYMYHGAGVPRTSRGRRSMGTLDAEIPLPDDDPKGTTWCM